MEELIPATRKEPDPEGGWRGKDLTEEELTSNEELQGLKVVQQKGETDGVGEPNPS
jgi:hypothetical protein